MHCPCKIASRQRQRATLSKQVKKDRYIPNYSHLIGIMISKTIGFRGTHPNMEHPYFFEVDPKDSICKIWKL